MYVCKTFPLVGNLDTQYHSLSTTSTGVAKKIEGGWQLWKPQQVVASGPQSLTNLNILYSAIDDAVVYQNGSKGRVNMYM